MPLVSPNPCSSGSPTLRWSVLERYCLSVVPREICVKILVKNNTNQLIIIKKKKFVLSGGQPRWGVVLYLKNCGREPVASKKMTLGQLVPNFTRQIVSSKILRILRWKLWVTLCSVPFSKWHWDTKKTCRNKFTLPSGTLMFRLKEKFSVFRNFFDQWNFSIEDCTWSKLIFSFNWVWISLFVQFNVAWPYLIK